MEKKTSFSAKTIFIEQILTEASLLFEGSKVVISKTKNENIRDIVTNVDITINDFLVSKIKEHYPGEQIYSEEIENSEQVSNGFWTIDPIDGTSNFVAGIPHFAICLGFVSSNQPVLGGAINPITKQIFLFEKGVGAFLNGEKIINNSNFSMEKSIICFNSGREVENRDWVYLILGKVLHKVKSVKFMGSSALDFCFVGAGIIDACIYPKLSSMDISFAIGLIRETGGVVVNEKFEELNLGFETQRVLAFKNQNSLEEFKKIIF